MRLSTRLLVGPPNCTVVGRPLAIATVLVIVLVVTSACEDEPTDANQDTKMIEVSITGDSVTPSGERIEVEVGQPVDLVVKSDVAGEIHVHSDPEQEFDYEPGTTILMLQIDRPGVVEVESHDPDQVIVQLEVR
ncbi:MAG: hypothetical protein WKF79_05530 [Nocardioides sp.]